MTLRGPQSGGRGSFQLAAAPRLGDRCSENEAIKDGYGRDLQAEIDKRMKPDKDSGGDADPRDGPIAPTLVGTARCPYGQKQNCQIKKGRSRNP